MQELTSAARPPVRCDLGDWAVSPVRTAVRFTAGDLARTHFCAAPAPFVETVLGLVEIRRHRRRVSGACWHSEALRAFPATARLLLDLIPAAGYWPVFLDPLAPNLDEGLESVRATPGRALQEQLAAAWQGAGRPPLWLRAVAAGEREVIEAVQRGLRDFHAACVAPQWARIQESFRRDQAEHARVLAVGGLAELFSSLHKDLAWRDPFLQGAWRVGGVRLAGRGVQLVPSALWSGPPLFAVCPVNLDGNALIYPARPGEPAYLVDESPHLGGLIGRTRAAALRAVGDPCSTAELATRLGVSPPSASEHATALRCAGLIQTARFGRSVRHSLTPLGRSLLKGH